MRRHVHRCVGLSSQNRCIRGERSCRRSSITNAATRDISQHHLAMASEASCSGTAPRRIATASVPTHSITGFPPVESHSRSSCAQRPTRSRRRCGRPQMTTLVREPGTYRTRAGELIHCRIDRDGTLILELEDERARGKLGGELVKLSDDPDWPDVRVPVADIELFAD